MYVKRVTLREYLDLLAQAKALDAKWPLLCFTTWLYEHARICDSGAEIRF